MGITTLVTDSNIMCYEEERITKKTQYSVFAKMTEAYRTSLDLQEDGGITRKNIGDGTDNNRQHSYESYHTGRRL